jgi:phosphatidylglycerol lysyltransferase
MSAEWEDVRDQILHHGWNSTCYQLLNPGFQYWISKKGDAVAGYVEYAGTRIVGGSPVCAFERLPDVVDEFEADSAALGLHVCYFASEARLESVIAKRAGYAITQLGAQPVWNPRSLVEKMAAKSSLRGQLNRAFHKGLIVEEWSAGKATGNLTLKKILDDWLSTRGLPSLHFLVEPETLSSLEDRRIFVALRDMEAVGFLNASPIPGRNGWLVEQFVRGHDAPNGTVELMLHRAAEIFAEEGYEYLTLGLSPLTQQAQTELPETSPIIRFLLRWARAHGKRFYDFEGLEFFKTKFEPEYWEPIYAISNEPRFSLHALYAIACAFTKGHPIRTVTLGIGKAIRYEVRNLARSGSK